MTFSKISDHSVLKSVRHIWLFENLKKCKETADICKQTVEKGKQTAHKYKQTSDKCTQTAIKCTQTAEKCTQTAEKGKQTAEKAEKSLRMAEKWILLSISGFFKYNDPVKNPFSQGPLCFWHENNSGLMPESIMF